jgi:hypothetical protein
LGDGHGDVSRALLGGGLPPWGGPAMGARGCRSMGARPPSRWGGCCIRPPRLGAQSPDSAPPQDRLPLRSHNWPFLTQGSRPRSFPSSDIPRWTGSTASLNRIIRTPLNAHMPHQCMTQHPWGFGQTSEWQRASIPPTTLRPLIDNPWETSPTGHPGYVSRTQEQLPLLHTITVIVCGVPYESPRHSR